MKSSENYLLQAELRESKGGSRAARRLRRLGQVPGVLYGAGEDPQSFAVNARTLRSALASSSAVIDLELNKLHVPVVLKEVQHHPVRGDFVHVDLLRVQLDKPVHTTVSLELLNAETAAGVREGGILEWLVREVEVEALPGDIPESIQYDVGSMSIGETVTLADVKPPQGAKILGDHLDETTVVMVTAPRLQRDEEEAAEREADTSATEESTSEN